jgi:alanyl-tRNA synthetase
MITANELRKLYIKFFISKGHSVIPSASLIPENDPTVLFTTAGMHPLVPYFLGETHPAGKRLVDVQKCIRTTDIDEVGDSRHLTFFEMLGNWSLGDYFKKEAIAWSWDFLTGSDNLNLDPKRIYVTVFMGNEDSSLDEVSISAWQEQYAKVGISAEVCPYGVKIKGKEEYRIFPLPAKDNWWGPAGETGPCGPCSEMFYDVNPEQGALKLTFDEEVDKERIMEIWNDVFMEFNKIGPGQFIKLPQQHVDTGMGLERTVAVINGFKDVFAIKDFHPLLHKIEELSGKNYGQNENITKAMRIIADHIKAVTFIMGDPKGISPSNIDQGYVVRRLLRRAIRYGRVLGINKRLWTKEVAETVVHDFSGVYPELNENIHFITANIEAEEEKFMVTLEKGLREFDSLAAKRKPGEILNGRESFNLFQSFGFPLEITKEIASERGLTVDEKGFENEQTKHQELSRTASRGKFKGGLSDASEDVRKLHTAAHLMLAALRKVLGDHVTQKGSNITPERLRFDFSHPAKMTADQISEVELLVNKAIKDRLAITCEEMSLVQAKEKGAMGVFDSKYDEKVKVYTIGDKENNFSKEICGGPHVSNTSFLTNFSIIKEESSSAGVRRIKAVLK